MRYLLYTYILITIFLTPLLCVGASNGDSYRAVYRYDYIRDSVNSSYNHDILYLELCKDSSFCFSRYTWEYDSILREPNGKKKHNQLVLNAVQKEGIYTFSYPHRMSGFMISKLNHRKDINVQNWHDGEYYQYSDNPTDFNWTISDSTKLINNYLAIKAECSYHGRNWTVWFCPELPWSDGPWKFTGLPGLVIQAYDSDKLYLFNLSGMYINEKPIRPWVTRANHIDRLDFLKKEYNYYKHFDYGMDSFIDIKVKGNGFDEIMYRKGIEPDFLNQ